MFDTDGPGSVFAAVSPSADVAASPAEPRPVPLERLEAQICELAGHLAAATCRFLVLLADFDARVDLHHIQHWVNGGRTDLDNLISLCSYHHKVVHDRGYLVAAPPPGGGTFTFYRPDGSPLPVCPPLPEPNSGIDTAHDADITPDTIIPPWYGERLDLDHAIYVCFANARTRQERERGQDGDPAGRGRVTVYEPEDWPERYRQYCEHTPRRTGPTLIPIQV
jgi:HNH endonuclease